eukprot:134344-Hanusia_phi.AAC.2
MMEQNFCCHNLGLVWFIVLSALHFPAVSMHQLASGDSEPDSGSHARPTVRARVVGQAVTQPEGHLLYMAPALVSTLAPQNVPATGSIQVTVQGMNFGSSGSTVVTGRIGTAAEWTTWTSDTQLVLQPSSALFLQTAVTITVEGSATTSVQTISIDSPCLSGSFPSNRPKWYRNEITVFGSGLAMFDWSASLRYGSTSFERSQWESDSSIVCSIEWSGTKSSNTVSITLAELKSSCTESFSFDKFPLSTIFPSNLIKLRQISITTASAIDSTSSLSARLGSTSISQTKWNSFSSLTLRVDAGISSSWSLRFTVNNLVGTISNVFSFDVGTFSSANSPLILPTLHVIGDHFAPFSITSALRVGHSSCELTSWTSDSTLMARASASSASMLTVVLTTNAPLGCLSEAFTYDMVQFGSSYGDSDRNAPTGGSFQQALLIAEMTAYDTTLSVRLGGSAARSSPWQSSSSLNVKSSSGIGHDLKLTLTVSNRHGSCSDFYSYDSAHLKNASALEMSTEIETKLEFSGSGFGYFLISPSIKVGHTLMEQVLWTSDSTVSALSRPGVGGMHDLNYNDVLANGNIQFSYSPPTISYLTATSFPTLHLEGFDFGRWSDYTPQTRLSYSSSQWTQWFSTSSISVRMPNAQGGSLRLVVTVQQQLGSSRPSVTYDAHWSRAMGNVAEQLKSFYLVGLGVYSNSIASRSGSTASMSTLWISDSEINIKSAASLRADVSVALTSSILVHTSTWSLSFDLPILMLSMTNIPAMPWSVSSTTAKFSQPSYSSKLRFGKSAAKMTSWSSYSSIASIATAGYKGTLPYVLTAASRQSSMSEALSYDTSTLGFSQSQLSTNLRSKPSAMIIPSAFSQEYQASVSFRFGFTEAEYTAWIAESVILTKSPSGHARSLSLVLSASQTSTLSSLLSFDKPTVTGLVQMNASLADGAQILVYGTDFGLYDASIAAVVETSSNGTNHVSKSCWTSDTSIHVFLLPVYGETFLYFQSYGYRTSRISFHFSPLDMKGNQRALNFTEVWAANFSNSSVTSRYWFTSSQYLHCQMRHDWEQIVNDMDTFLTGGLGHEMAGGVFEVWVCSYEDACSLPGDAFCYIFDEEKELFVPW